MKVDTMISKTNNEAGCDYSSTSAQLFVMINDFPNRAKRIVTQHQSLLAASFYIAVWPSFN
jgi:hypothetical protein